MKPSLCLSAALMLSITALHSLQAAPTESFPVTTSDSAFLSPTHPTECSNSGYCLSIQNGGINITDLSGKIIKSIYTPITPETNLVHYLNFQTDGNLVAYMIKNNAGLYQHYLWASNTRNPNYNDQSPAPYVLDFNKTGDLSIYLDSVVILFYTINQ